MKKNGQFWEFCAGGCRFRIETSSDVTLEHLKNLQHQFSKNGHEIPLERILMLKGVKVQIEVLGTQKKLPEYSTIAPQPHSDVAPRIASFILFLIPKTNREHIVGDLEEEYRTLVLPRYGKGWATFWYWWQVLCVIRPYAWTLLRRAAGIEIIWKLIGR